MFLGRRSFLLICIAVGIIAKSNGQSDKNSSSNYNNDENGLVGTYRTPIEQTFQGLLNVVDDVKDSTSEGGGIRGFLSKIVPKRIKEVLEPVEKSVAKSYGDFLNLFEDRFHAIHPGTLWCGGGNIASDEYDLGVFAETDSCCQAHDKCPKNIEAGKSLGPLLNDGAFTRSACFCDQEFYNCLKNVSSLVSVAIGTTYFNILRPQCFSLDYPIKNCTRENESNPLREPKCIHYDFDESQNKKLEWFDNPDF